ncbi:MAG: ThuA domain-containing protein [Bryobacterales bacterium]
MTRRIFLALPLSAAVSSAAGKMRALLIDGQNNHKTWPQTTPLIKRWLEESGLFAVEIATTPPAGQDNSNFQPRFADYDLVVSNYNGEMWPEPTRRAFERFVSEGGGFVSVHAADNAFAQWKAYNEMIAVGGWEGRNQASGPYLRLRDGKWVRDETTPGTGGHHGERHEFVVEIRDPSHPVTRGLPKKWRHAEDELYDQLRGPARNVDVLASAFSEPSTRGTGEDEPMLMAISFGKGRVFHTTLGHSPEAMHCVGFIATLQRGAEWAATGKVTQSVPKDFPGPDEVSLRP